MDLRGHVEIRIGGGLADPVLEARRALAAAERTGAQVVVPKPGARIDVLEPPELEDWWTAVGSLAADEPGVHTQGPGSALLVRAATRLLRLGS